MEMYKCLNSNEYKNGDHSLIPIREQDIYKIKEWRNEQIDILRQKEPLTDENQKRYFNEVIKPSFSEQSPRQILFSYLHKDECIGYGGLTNMDWDFKRAEMSFLLNPKYVKDTIVYSEYLSIFITLIKKIIFEEINFNRVFTETYDMRDLHIEILEKNGFSLEGRMREHIFIKGQFIDSLIHGLIKKQYEIEK